MLTHTRFTGDTGLSCHEHIRNEPAVLRSSAHSVLQAHLFHSGTWARNRHYNGCWKQPTGLFHWYDQETIQWAVSFVVVPSGNVQSSRMTHARVTPTLMQTFWNKTKNLSMHKLRHSQKPFQSYFPANNALLKSTQQARHQYKHLPWSICRLQHSSTLHSRLAVQHLSEHLCWLKRLSTEAHNSVQLTHMHFMSEKACDLINENMSAKRVLTTVASLCKYCICLNICMSTHRVGNHIG